MDEYKPGLGQYYCVTCARYFISPVAMKAHLKAKDHKKRLKATKEIPYTHEEAEMAAGLRPSKETPFADAIHAGKRLMSQLVEEIDEAK